MGLSLRQGSEYQGNNYWRWWVWLDGPEEELDGVEQVTYTLDPSFTDPVRVVSDLGSRFRLETAGWGVFRLFASVSYEDGASLSLHHDLELTYPAGEEPQPEPKPEPTAAAQASPLVPASPRRQADGVFEGGATSVFAFAGALTAAEEAGITEWVDVVGSSGGAIVATLLAVGYTAKEINKSLSDGDYGRLFDSRSRTPRDWWSVLRRGDTGRGDYLRAWLETRFDEKLGKRNPTFADVVHPERRNELSPVERYGLHLVASDITAGRMIVLPDDIEDYEDAEGQRFRRDDFPLIEAVTMSMSMPIGFTPSIVYRSRKPYFIADGRLLSTFPIWLLDTPTPVRPTWGFHVHGGSGTERLPYRRLSRGTFAMTGVLGAMISSVVEAWDPRYISSDTVARTISIETREIGSGPFKLSKQEIESLHSWGYEATRTFFSVPREYFNSFGVAPVGAPSSIVAS